MPEDLSPYPEISVSGGMPEEAFGGGRATRELGQVAQELSDMAAKYAGAEKRQADETRVLHAKSIITEFQNRLLFGENGVLTRKGIDATKDQEKYEIEFQKTAQEISANLGNDEQRAAFEKYTIQSATELNETILKHAYTEQNQMWLDEKYNNFNTQISKAVAFAGDRKTRELALLEAETALENTDKERAFAKRSWGYMQVVKKLLDINRPDLADEFYKKNQLKFMGQEQSIIPDEIKKGISRNKVDYTIGDLSQKYGSNIDEMRLKISDQKYDLNVVEQKEVNDYFDKQKSNLKDAEESRQNKLMAQADIMAVGFGGAQKVPRARDLFPNPTDFDTLSKARQDQLVSKYEGVHPTITPTKAHIILKRFYNLNVDDIRKNWDKDRFIEEIYKKLPRDKALEADKHYQSIISGNNPAGFIYESEVQGKLGQVIDATNANDETIPKVEASFNKNVEELSRIKKDDPKILNDAATNTIIAIKAEKLKQKPIFIVTPWDEISKDKQDRTNEFAKRNGAINKLNAIQGAKLYDAIKRKDNTAIKQIINEVNNGE